MSKSNPYIEGVADLPEHERDHVMLDIETHYPDKEIEIMKFKVTAEVSLTADEAQTMAEEVGNEDDFTDDQLEATRENIRDAFKETAFDHFDATIMEVIAIDG